MPTQKLCQEQRAKADSLLKRPAADHSTLKRPANKRPHVESSSVSRLQLAPRAGDDVLTRYAKVLCAKLKCKNPKLLNNAVLMAHGLSDMHHCSACSGSDISWLSTTAVMQTLGTGDDIVAAVHCEADTKKARFIADVTCQLHAEQHPMYL